MRSILRLHIRAPAPVLQQTLPMSASPPSCCIPDTRIQPRKIKTCGISRPATLIQIKSQVHRRSPQKRGYASGASFLISMSRKRSGALGNVSAPHATDPCLRAGCEQSVHDAPPDKKGPTPKHRARQEYQTLRQNYRAGRFTSCRLGSGGTIAPSDTLSDGDRRTASACRARRPAHGAARDVHMPLSCPMGVGHSGGHGNRKQRYSKSPRHFSSSQGCTSPGLGSHVATGRICSQQTFREQSTNAP